SNSWSLIRGERSRFREVSSGPLLAEKERNCLGSASLPASHSMILARRTTLRAVPPRAAESGSSLRFETKQGVPGEPERLGSTNRDYARCTFNVVPRRRVPWP